MEFFSSTQDCHLREAVLSVAAEYATGESQSNSSKNSLLPWYRKVLSKSAYEDEYEVLVLSRQHQRTSIKRWPRETRQVSEFTGIGKKCLKRLQLQIELRLPAPNPNDCLSVLIDPATKNFVNWLLGADLFLKSRTLLKRKHRDAYMALKNNQGLAQTNAEQDQDKTTEGQVLDLNFEAGEDNGGGC